MGVRPLRSVNGIGSVLHPAECLPRILKIRSEGITRFLPLRALVAGLAQAQLAACAGGGIDDLQPLVGVIGVTQNARPLAVRSYVPAVVRHYRRDLARGPVH